MIDKLRRIGFYTSLLALFCLHQIIGQEACVDSLEKGEGYTLKTGTQGFALEASETVVLKPGAWVQSGAEVVAQITDCTTQAENNVNDLDDGLSNTAQSGSGNNISDTSGSLSIGGGSANYTLPIALPPSIKDLGPQINLGYTSGKIHGIAGMGWSINGISKIHRISSRIDIDEFQNGVQFNESTDKLAIDGVRLILKEGDYWGDGSIYQTEIQSNTRIELKKNGDHFSFIVTSPEGMRFWYGRNYWGSVDGYSTTGYHIVRQEDVHGNYITYD